MFGLNYQEFQKNRGFEKLGVKELFLEMRVK